DPDPASVPLRQQEGSAAAGATGRERGALRPHPLSVRQPAGQLLLRADRLPQAAVAGGRGALRQHQLLNTAKKAFVFHEDQTRS
ncbi:hypothetical protein ABTG54_22070, partial [Acinetobacter baumannii]